MVVSTGVDVTILIDGVDYSTKISAYSEEGGGNTYAIVRSFGNNYEHVLTGRENYTLNLEHRMNGTELKALFENTTPVTIVISDTNMTITYYNMLPKTMTPQLDPEDITGAALQYEAPAFDKANNRYNRVLA